MDWRVIDNLAPYFILSGGFGFLAFVLFASAKIPGKYCIAAFFGIALVWPILATLSIPACLYIFGRSIASGSMKRWWNGDEPL